LFGRTCSADKVPFRASTGEQLPKAAGRNSWGGMSVTDNVVDAGRNTVDTGHRPEPRGHPGTRRRSVPPSTKAPPCTKAWTAGYLRRAAMVDGGCALLAGLLAAQIRFGNHRSMPVAYLCITAALPVLWCAAVLLGGGDDAR